MNLDGNSGMARKQKKAIDGPSSAWLVTFSDLMTLLLTFFVLLLSMSSMDRTTISKITPFKESVGVMHHSARGKVQQRILLVTRLIDNPQDLMLERNKIRDLLFPDEVLPKDINSATLDENLKILTANNGVALVFSDKILFERGRANLTPAAIALLDQVRSMLEISDSDVIISGYAEPSEYQADDLASQRALAVLAQFINAGLAKDRFAVGAYVQEPDPTRGLAGRRVEIFVKTVRVLGEY